MRAEPVERAAVPYAAGAAREVAGGVGGRPAEQRSGVARAHRADGTASTEPSQTLDFFMIFWCYYILPVAFNSRQGYGYQS